MIQFRSLDTKFYTIDKPTDAQLLMRQIGAGVRKVVNLQKYRPHIVAENVVLCNNEVYYVISVKIMLNETL